MAPGGDADGGIVLEDADLEEHAFWKAVDQLRDQSKLDPATGKRRAAELLL